jgi:hypothetical protein
VASLGFPKAQSAERAKDFAPYFRGPRIHSLSVVVAIRMSEADTGRVVASDFKLPPMRCAMMRAAKRNKVLRVVVTTFGPRADVVKIQVARVSAARNDAALMIATQHRSARRRRDSLLRATQLAIRGGERVSVGAADI